MFDQPSGTEYVSVGSNMVVVYSAGSSGPRQWFCDPPYGFGQRAGGASRSRLSMRGVRPLRRRVLVSAMVSNVVATLDDAADRPARSDADTPAASRMRAGRTDMIPPDRKGWPVNRNRDGGHTRARRRRAGTGLTPRASGYRSVVLAFSGWAVFGILVLVVLVAFGHLGAREPRRTGPGRVGASQGRRTSGCVARRHARARMRPRPSCTSRPRRPESPAARPCRRMSSRRRSTTRHPDPAIWSLGVSSGDLVTSLDIENDSDQIAVSGGIADRRRRCVPRLTGDATRHGVRWWVGLGVRGGAGGRRRARDPQPRWCWRSSRSSSTTWAGATASRWSTRRAATGPTSRSSCWWSAMRSARCSRARPRSTPPPRWPPRACSTSAW